MRDRRSPQTGTRWNGIWLAVPCVALVIGGVATQAQESPELPPKPLTATEPVAAQQVSFYKGKGPGRGNSYVARFEEDYGYLRDPAKSTDFFDPLKYVAIDRDRDIYLTLNGEARFRYDYTGYRNLAVGLSRDWGSCRDGCWRMRIVGGLEALPEAGAERAVVDGAADLEQPVGPAPGPAHLLRLGHAPVDQEIGRALGQ